MTRALARQRGFTLVEVMLALAILFGGLVVLMQATAGNIYTADRSYMLGVATDLARGKMYDLEEELLQEGFSDQDEEESGDFDEQGWPNIEWEAEIIRPEIPDLAAMAQAAQEAEEDDDSAPLPGTEDMDDVLGEEGALGEEGPLGAMGAMGGDAAAGGMAALLPPSMLRMLQGVLEEAIRKVELTVSWQSARGEESMLVEAYFTEPKEVSRVLGGLGQTAGGLEQGEGQDEDGEGDGEEDEEQNAPERGGGLRNRR